MLKTATNLPLDVRINVERALQEDVGSGDVTASLIPELQMVSKRPTDTVLAGS